MMALGLSGEEIKSEVFDGLIKPRSYLNSLPNEEFQRIATVIADVMTENNQKILYQLAITDMDIKS